VRVQSNKTDAISPILALECEDWSPQEQYEIGRLRASCVEHPSLSLETGLTDERDPWWILYDRESEQVIFHVARIDHSYIIARGESRCKKTASMREATDVAMRVLAHRQRPTRTGAIDRPQRLP
jgi:hypothetical protein